ncbi:NAD(+)--dinitrogen-reductase ADP-D-ribosyltransferase [Ketobacter sp.]|uniref:NAD(+)--dinitrogen-reductase ADP-D-ribosyltransferase n=1 Tax=Ketobacter sp. TaxID=2083498 RepID=UPI000F200C73|nr:NAD(+)--dinitrogen-reductase ADP-D-ribosyltransferase [Ketobacter sp.]RLU01838.1 MAG: NAD(+)--dinitrogen-reductase ADP-D-ribosyltransferase [Ketobacter sp.]
MSSKPATLPAYARSALNHCNLPAVILGGLTYQRHPEPIEIDGVQVLHRALFGALDRIDDPAVRALHFRDYMSACFLLDHKERAGFDPDLQRVRRGRADYLRLLRGWMFDADSIEGAVLKRWVESRFGLLTRRHGGPLREMDSAAYHAYQADYVRGLYNTNALEAQLDLLYSYCQYELRRRHGGRLHWTLYRGLNRLQDFECMSPPQSERVAVLLNNLNSFSADREQACAFGDTVLAAQVPLPKLLYFHDLLPGVLKGEQEFLVIGGVYEVLLSY